MGESKHDGLAIPGRVVLAHELPFTLGKVHVDPATRQVERESRRETLEPRVMQVLVALARAKGAIVTRDELIDRCWDGRIVTHDAINRVLSRIRQVAADIGGGSFGVETITKVGYRLTQRRADAGTVVPFPPPSARATEPRASRRGLIAGAAAGTVLLGAGSLGWLRPWAYRPAPEAEQLYRRGSLLMREGLPGQVRQGVSYFERAVATDPKYSDAWGALALSYSHLLAGFDEAELASLPDRIRAAARRSLEIDADNADAQLALIFITPYFGNWSTKEAELRRIVRAHPQHWLANARLGILLYQVGRLSEGIEQHRMALQIEPMLPISYFYLINNLSALGRAQEAEALIDKAQDRWPAHPAVWSAKYNHLLFSGKPRSAAALAMDPATLPSAFGPEQVETRLRLARAIETMRPADVEASVKDYQRLAIADFGSIPTAAVVFAALGRPDLTFASLERYYFNRGSFGQPAPVGPYIRGNTDALFTQPMAAARADPRFAIILRQTGLESYWRRTGTVPDFRRPR